MTITAAALRQKRGVTIARSSAEELIGYLSKSLESTRPCREHCAHQPSGRT